MGRKRAAAPTGGGNGCRISLIVTALVAFGVLFMIPGHHKKKALATSQAYIAALAMMDEPAPPKNGPKRPRRATCTKTYSEAGSRPGVPCLPPALEEPYSSNTAWREDLGKRIVAIATPTKDEEECARFSLITVAAVCEAAIGKESQAAALVFGPEVRDAWCKTMETVHKLPLHFVNLKAGSRMGGRTSLVPHLEAHGPLSVHAKMDLEGEEWPLLEELLERPQELAKLRTLDVHLHFSSGSVGVSTKEQQRLTKRVDILEKLAGLLAVVGSSLESDREAWQPEVECVKASCPEPSLHPPQGASMDEFWISFVNTKSLPAGPAFRVANWPPPPTPRKDVKQIAAIAQSPDCRPRSRSPSSRPGIPCLPPLENGKDPWRTTTQWRIDLGERIVAAVSADDLQEKDCGKFTLFGDSVWCTSIMSGKGTMGLSYGIEERDLWSEKMSQIWKMRTRLYDCFIPPKRSPPIAGTAPNGTEDCDHWPGHCYGAPYEPYRICLGAEHKTIQHRNYETLQEHLDGHDVLALHLKIDSEGTEWAVLKRLLTRPEEIAKIRTLDMEVHFSYRVEGGDTDEKPKPEQELLTERVEILEGLLKYFYCTGSTLEVYREEKDNDRICPRGGCGEANLHLPRGMSLDQFAVSYVSKGLVGPGGKPLSKPVRVTKHSKGGAQGGAAPTPAPAAPASFRKRSPETPTTTNDVAPPQIQTQCVAKYRDQSSRPGKPCMPRPLVNPFSTETSWRVQFGERVLAAVEGQVTEEDCDGFELFGDHTWCLRAMRSKGVRGFSYGIEERDLWSEKMSNNFKMPTQLYDCFIPPQRSPPIAGTAPNGTQSCQGYGGHCYETPYEPYRICLGPEKKRINGRPYETLADHLRGHKPLSLHLKIDSEGTEWAILEQLLASPADQDKIRTLEMEVHFSYVPEGDTDTARKMSEKDRLEQRVSIMERLRERFVCTGSNLEVYGESHNFEKLCPGSSCKEPNIHYKYGMSVDQFAVSYVHRRLVPEASERIGPVNGVVVTGSQSAGNLASAAMSRIKKGAAAAASAADDEDEDSNLALKLPEWPPVDRPCTPKTHSQSSRPGKPCMPQAKIQPYKTDTQWRAIFGERVLQAVTGTVKEEQCGGFELFGDHVWCLKVFRQPGVMGLSYGIEERDLWSEKMSNVFHMYTQLYDCFIPPRQSPPIAKTAPNGTGSCERAPGHCYETPYDSFRICLGPEEKVINQRRYTTIFKHLAGRPPLSTHLKIDTEGTEWAILERLLDSPEDLDKIRTLEMEVHFSYVPEGDDPQVRSLSEKKRLANRVRIMERMLERFACTGTNLEVYRESWPPETECAGSRCNEPVVHLYRGMSVDQFAVSYVNRDLL